MTVLATLYRRIDELLEVRARDYPRRVEPTFGELQSAIRELASALRTHAEDVMPEQPPSAFVASPVFVVGYYRSGTTLMHGLLQGHPDVVGLPGESKHFARPEPTLTELHDGWIRRLVSPDGLPPFWTLGRPWEEEDDCYALFTRRLLAYASGRRPGQDLLGLVAAAVAAAAPDERPPLRWVEKTPRNELLVDRILGSYPSASFVHMVRDPRATVASIREWNRGQHLASVPVAAVELERSLVAAHENARRLGSDRYLVVRYEELVAEPEEQMRRVAAHLGLDWADALLTPSATANSSTAGRRVQGRIHRLSTEGGNELTGWPDAVVRAFAAAPADALGYDVPAGSRAVALATRAYLSATFRARRARARVRARGLRLFRST
ncbi:MAG TPA: sulfotransferase [Gaiellaceae bacterium]|nr:sulfotransferase [Gaiellaceae bacterium]